MLSHYVPAISPGQKWWQTILKIKVSCSQWEGSACTHEAPSFFLWGGGVEERDFLFFPCSQSVPIVFSWDSQVVPQDVSKSTSDLPHMICPRFNSHLSMKEGSLSYFVLYLWDPPNQDASDCALTVFGKLSMRRGARAWFHDLWTCSAKVLEHWMISTLKIKLNHSWKFQKKWNVPLVLLKRSW